MKLQQWSEVEQSMNIGEWIECWTVNESWRMNEIWALNESWTVNVPWTVNES